MSCFFYPERSEGLGRTAAVSRQRKVFMDAGLVILSEACFLRSGRFYEAGSLIFVDASYNIFLRKRD